MSEKRLAIITARGGSKRIPYKNIREFCGRPIIVYSIEAALQSGVFDEVMVSTDDEKIALIAKEAGAKVPFLRYKKRGQQFQSACCIYPTAPFITSEKLKNAVELLETRDYDSVMPVAEFSFPPLRGMVMTEDKVSYKWEEFAMTRSQDLDKIYHDVGQFYVFDVKKFEEAKKLVTKNTGAIIIDELEMQDIDNEVDWKLAELKYQLLQEKR